MATRYAWVLNLDGDLELARGPGYCPTAGVRRALAASRPCAQRSCSPIATCASTTTLPPAPRAG